MTKEQMNEIKNYIADTFDCMTIVEFDDRAHGTGTLSVLDEALSKYGYEPTDYEATELTRFCCNQSNEYLTIRNINAEINDIAKDFNDNISLLLKDCTKHNIGRFKFWLDMLTDLNDMFQDTTPDYINALVTFYFEYLMIHGHMSHEAAEYKDEYVEELRNTMYKIMESFVTNYPDLCDDQDAWIQHLQDQEYLTWQEQRYINIHWTDEMKAKFRRPRMTKVYKLD